MPQAQGSLARLSYAEEVIYGVTPVSPAMKLLKAATYGESLGANIAELTSNAINANRAVEYARGGNITVGGSVPFELPILGIGTLMKHALGPATSVIISAGPLYTHTIKRGALPVGLSIEKGFTDISRYDVYRGCKVTKMSIDVKDGSLATGSLDLVGKDFVATSSTSLGVPTAVAHVPYVEFESAILEGGGAATVLGFKFDLSNEIESVQTISSRYIAEANATKGSLTGEITFLLDTTTITGPITKWLNETASSLKLTFTSGSNSIEFFLPNIRYFGDGKPKIASTQGVVVPLTFRAIYDTTELTDLKITIINTETSL